MLGGSEVSDADLNQDADPQVGLAEAEVGSEESGKSLEMDVSIEDVGPCKKHIRIVVKRSAIDDVYADLLDEYVGKAEVPGFRVGHVPASLVSKRFKSELAEQAKQRVLMASLEQLGENSELDPINQPNLDLDSIEIPEEGDFEYEFDIEVRPSFELPDYKGLEITRPNREVTDEEVDAYLSMFLDQYGKLTPIETPAEAGDFVAVNIKTTHNGELLSTLRDVSIRIRPTLRFQDAEFEGFAEFMQGVQVGDVRETTLTISDEADSIPMRQESVQVAFEVLDVKRTEVPELNEDFFDRIGVTSEEELRDQIFKTLERQVRYEQRQATRELILEKITESADWDLPEDLVKKQVENALRREILEMQQAGFTSKEILARENVLRQQSLSMTRQNLKEHFVLDRIAELEGIEVNDYDLDVEIYSMAMQRGENPRRLRARMVKNGSIENLEAQIRERKAVDVIIDNAKFVDTEMPPLASTQVEALNRSLCSAESQASADEEEDSALADE